MGNGFLHIFLNEPFLVDGPDSGNCPKQGVSHSDAKPFWFLRTKDGHNEFNNSLLPMVPTIPKVKSVLRVVLSSKIPYIQTILAASPSLTLPWCESVKLCPYLSHPLLRVMPHSLKPLVSSLEQELCQGRLVSEALGFGEEPLTTHPGEVIYQFLQLNLTLKDSMGYILQGNMDLLNLILLSCFRHLATPSSFQLPLDSFLQIKKLSATINEISTIQLLAI